MEPDTEGRKFYPEPEPQNNSTEARARAGYENRPQNLTVAVQNVSRPRIPDRVYTFLITRLPDLHSQNLSKAMWLFDLFRTY